MTKLAFVEVATFFAHLLNTKIDWAFEILPGSAWCFILAKWAKKPSLVGLYTGRNPTQLYRDYFISHEISRIRIPINQPVFHGIRKGPGFFSWLKCLESRKFMNFLALRLVPDAVHDTNGRPAGSDRNETVRKLVEMSPTYGTKSTYLYRGEIIHGS